MTRNKDITIVHDGNLSFVHSEVGCHIFEIQGNYRLAQPAIMPFYNHSRTLAAIRIEGYEIIPYGLKNDYPDVLREILDENNLTPEILRKQAALTFGQGPALYKIVIKDGKRQKEFVNDPEVEQWLKNWDYEEYLLKGCIEYRTINGRYSKFFRNKGFRIGAKPFITELQHVSNVFARLEWPDENGRVNHIIVGDFYVPWRLGLKSYPVFDWKDPFRYPVSMNYSSLHGYALDHEYPRAPWHGTINWIKLSSSIAKLLTNFNMNSAAIKYHVKVPVRFWEDQEDKLRQKCIMEGVEYTADILEKLKTEIFSKVTAALSSEANVGKMLSTDEVWDDDGRTYVGWKIDVLDQKVKDFIDAQINIASHAQYETTSGIGLHPAISNLSKDGNLPSGSEQLYAFKIYLSTDTDIPESIICKDINWAIKVNFPSKDLRIGFYHDNVLTEEMTNPVDRVKNQGSAVNKQRNK